ncbi:MAG: hypothetical protein ACYSSI_06630, partial [Planctomycetota bacterium]
MNRYHSYNRPKYRKGKLVIVMVILVIAALKICTRDVSPAFTIADENEIVIPVVEPYTEDTTLLPTTGTISEPNLHQIPDSVSESNPGLIASIDDVLACIEAKPPRIIEARDNLNKMLLTTMSGQQLSFVKKQLSMLSKKWLFSGTVFSED